VGDERKKIKPEALFFEKRKNVLTRRNPQACLYQFGQLLQSLAKLIP
jgi:hypothetical protein